jgi:C1A family cysteine protease
MNSKLLALLLLAGITSVFLYSTSHQKHTVKFAEWSVANGKTYENQVEQIYREKIFNENVALLEEHNADKTQTYKMGINQFSDLTQSEFATIYLTLKVNKRFERTVSAKPSAIVGDVDWVAAGKVSNVKNQASCGSCWAFSAIGAVESAYLIRGTTVLLSEQQLVDCSGAYGNYGCNGGWMDSAFQYIIDHGITTESAYPYVARNQVCQADGGSYRLGGFVDVQGCDNLANALNQQPISVAVDASNWSPYRSGIFSNCATSVNHGVLLVGATSSYWVIKNSWGNSWGESGYIRLAKGNTCAICNYPSYPRI